MDIQTIVADLKSELDRIAQVIGLLEGNAPAKKRVGRPPASAGSIRPRRGGNLTPAGRRKLSEAMKLRWAQRRSATRVSKAPAVAKSKKRVVSRQRAANGSPKR